MITCGVCGKEWTEECFVDDREPCAGEGRYVSAIPDLFARLAPGDPLPYGDCPACGCLCYLVEEAPTVDRDPKVLAFRR